MKNKTSSLIAAAAMAGLVGGAMFTVTGCHSDRAGMESSSSSHHQSCAGQNACKGLGGCKTATHACKGMNACKGQGGCKA
ncbi:MAG: hypothetical protein ABJC04_12965 [Verrucomicrobiota bacterium]